MTWIDTMLYGLTVVAFLVTVGAALWEIRLGAIWRERARAKRRIARRLNGANHAR